MNYTKFSWIKFISISVGFLGSRISPFPGCSLAHVLTRLCLSSIVILILYKFLTIDTLENMHSNYCNEFHNDQHEFFHEYDECKNNCQLMDIILVLYRGILFSLCRITMVTTTFAFFHANFNPFSVCVIL